MERTPDSPIPSSDAEAALGGADAVNDTPGIARHGTTPGSPLPPVVDSTQRSGRWLFIALLIVAVLIYFARFMR
jgi:hypothetical protein